MNPIVNKTNSGWHLVLPFDNGKTLEGEIASTGKWLHRKVTDNNEADTDLVFPSADTVPSNRVDKINPRNKVAVIGQHCFGMGGAERVSLDIARALYSDGWEVHVVASSRHVLGETTKPDFKEVATTHSLHDAGTSKDDALRSIIRYVEPETIFVNNLIQHKSVFSFLPTECRTIAIQHADHKNFNWTWPISVTSNMRSIDAVLTISNEIAGTMAARGLPPSRFIPVHWGVDTTKFQPEIKPTQKSFRFIFPSRLSPEKRPVLAIDAINEASKVVDVSLAFAGQGGLDDRARDYAKRINAPVEFLGRVPHDDLPGVMNEHDAVLSTSSREGIPLCLMEAAACELPIIASDVSQVHELVSEEVGSLVPDPYDRERHLHLLVDAIIQLVQNPLLATRKGEAGRSRVVQHWNIDRVKRQILELVA